MRRARRRPKTSRRHRTGRPRAPRPRALPASPASPVTDTRRARIRAGPYRRSTRRRARFAAPAAAGSTEIVPPRPFARRPPRLLVIPAFVCRPTIFNLDPRAQMRSARVGASALTRMPERLAFASPTTASHAYPTAPAAPRAAVATHSIFPTEGRPRRRATATAAASITARRTRNVVLPPTCRTGRHVCPRRSLRRARPATPDPLFETAPGGAVEHRATELDGPTKSDHSSPYQYVLNASASPSTVLLAPTWTEAP